MKIHFLYFLDRARAWMLPLVGAVLAALSFGFWITSSMHEEEAAVAHNAVQDLKPWETIDEGFKGCEGG